MSIWRLPIRLADRDEFLVAERLSQSTATSGSAQKLKEREIMGTKPAHEQAQLHLQVYDLRREARLRAGWRQATIG